MCDSKQGSKYNKTIQMAQNSVYVSTTHVCKLEFLPPTCDQIVHTPNIRRDMAWTRRTQHDHDRLWCGSASFVVIIKFDDFYSDKFKIMPIDSKQSSFLYSRSPPITSLQCLVISVKKAIACMYLFRFVALYFAFIFKFANAALQDVHSVCDASR